MTPFAYAGVHLDLAYTLQLLRTSGADERQRAQMIEAVLRPIRSVKARGRRRRSRQAMRDCRGGEKSRPS